MASMVFIAFLYLPPAWKVLPKASKVLQEFFFSVVVVYGFSSLVVQCNFLEDRSLLKLRRLDSSCSFFLSENSIWGQ